MIACYYPNQHNMFHTIKCSPLKKWSGPASNKLSSYLGADICAAYYAMGMKEELYDWQAECLIQPGVLQVRSRI